MDHETTFEDKNFMLDKLNELAETLGLFVNSYRLLVGGAQEFTTIEQVTPEVIKAAIQRADNLGSVIDDMIKFIDCNLDIFLIFVELEKLKEGIKDIKGLRATLQTQTITIPKVEEVDDELTTEVSETESEIREEIDNLNLIPTPGAPSPGLP